MSWLNNFFIKSVASYGVKQIDRPIINIIGAVVSDNAATQSTDVDITTTVRANSAVVFDTDIDKSNIRANKLYQSAIDNTKSGIINLGSDTIGTYAGTTANYASILGGNCGVVSGEFGVIVDGYKNYNSGEIGFIGSGENNILYSSRGFIGTGYNNVVNGLESMIITGSGNHIQGQDAVILTGSANTVSNSYALVATGNNNTASGEYSYVLNGSGNAINGNYSLILNGTAGTISGEKSLILNGDANTIASTALCSMTIGNSNTINDGYCFVSGYNNQITLETLENPLYSKHNNVHGDSNILNSSSNCIVSGNSNNINYSYDNEAGSSYSTISGNSNSLIGSYKTLIVGNSNTLNTSAFNMIVGDSNTLSSCNSSLIIGSSCQCGNTGTISLGDNCKSPASSCITISGIATQPGYAQTSTFVVKTSSTSGYAMHVYFPATDTNKIFSVHADILIKKTGAVSHFARFIYDIVLHNDGEVNNIIDAVNESLKQSANDGDNWSVTVSPSEITIDAYGSDERILIARIDWNELYA